ncbi:MAG: DUF4143 domain-containing protein [bacterium]|nr:DUF4143 domain-containing protein [bacterium]
MSLIADYHPRLIDPLLEEILSGFPAVMLVGPRAVGKSTTAERHAATVVRLDKPNEAAIFRADPDAALRNLPEPILLDEWQEVPDVLGAVKRAVDTNRRPGRFLITGSVYADMQSKTWPGTGRVIRLTMNPLTVAEQLGVSPKPFLDRIAAGDNLLVPPNPPDILGYAALALQGGFPEAVFARSPKLRALWMQSYLNQMFTRDPETFGKNRDPMRLRRFFEAYALNAGGIATDKTIYDAAGINSKTAASYKRLFENLTIIDELPAWASNRLKRLTRAPKRNIVDSGLWAATLQLDQSAVRNDGGLLGRLLDIFVSAQLRAEIELAENSPRLYHLRQENGQREIDVIAELGARKIIGIEIKATSAPHPKDARHLAWLRDQLGERFVAGVVLHTGPQTFKLDTRITAAPICTLWTQ